MSSAPRVYSTSNGGTIEAVRRGQEIDLHYRAPDGRTVATVVLSEADAEALLNDLSLAVDV